MPEVIQLAAKYEREPFSRHEPVAEIHGRPRASRYLVRRDGLCETIDRATRSQLVVLRGPAAAGKTMTLVDWADRASDDGRAGVWVDASRLSSAESFWSGLQRRLAEAASIDLAESLMGWQEFAGTAEIGGPFLVIVDGLGRQLAAEIHADVIALLHRSPAMTMIVSSRARTMFESRQTLVEEDCVVMGDVDLSLSADETSAALARRGVVFSPDVVDAVLELCSGHAGVVTHLAVAMSSDAKAVWRGDDVKALSADPELRLDAWLRSALPPALRENWRLVTRTALLPYVSAAVLGRLTDRGDGRQAALDAAEHFLAELEDAGFGHWRRDAGERRFRYAEYVRLTVRLELSEMDADEAECLRRELMSMALEMDDPLTALEQAFTVCDWPQFSSICARHYAVIARDDGRALMDFLGAVPREVIDQDAWLSLLTGSVRQAQATDGDLPSDCRVHFENAEKLARVTHGAATETSTSAAVRIASARRSGRYNRAVAAAETLGSKNRAVGAEAESARVESVAQAAITHAHVGEYGTAVTLFGQVGRDPAARGHLAVQAAGYLALIHMLRGEVESAARWLTRLHEHTPHWAEWRHSVWSAPARCAAALVAMERGELKRASIELTTISSLGVRSEEWAFVAYATGVLGLLKGGGYAGLTAVRDAERDSPFETSRHLRALLDGVRSDLLLTMKQARPAAEALREYVDGSEPVVGAFARALLFSGANQRAAVFAGRGARHHQATPRSTVECQMVSTIARARLGDVAGAVRSLEDAVSLAIRHGLRIPLGMMPLDEIAPIIERCSPAVRGHLSTTPRIFHGELTLPSLTRRELVVLAHLRRSVPFDVIARDLSVSLNTVKSQARTLYRKLGVGSRSDAVRVAVEWHLLPLPGAEPETGRVA